MKKLVKILALTLCIAMLFSFASCMQDTEEGIPEGMINATAPGNDFRLYVPSTWTANTDYGVSGAYATLSQRSNVSMVKYSMTDERNETIPHELKDAEVASQGRLDWFYQTECLPTIKALTKETLTENVTEPNPALLDGNNARRYHQKGQVDGAELHFIHVITERVTVKDNATENAFYVFSFIVDSQLYDTLLSHVESMLTAFVFGDPYYPENYINSMEGGQAPEGMKLASNDEVAYVLYVPNDWVINRDERIFSAYAESDRSSVSVIPYMPDTTMSIDDLWEINKQAMIDTAGADGFGEIEVDNACVVSGKLCHAYRYFYTVNGQRYDYLQVILVHGDRFYCITYTALPEYYYEHTDEFAQILANIVFR